MECCYFILKSDIKRNIKRVRKGYYWGNGDIIGYNKEDILFNSFSIRETTEYMERNFGKDE